MHVFVFTTNFFIASMPAHDQCHPSAHNVQAHKATILIKYKETNQARIGKKTMLATVQYNKISYTKNNVCVQKILSP